MPVILTTPAECEAWLSVPVTDALALQRPLPSEELRTVPRGQKQDPPEDLNQESMLISV